MARYILCWVGLLFAALGSPLAQAQTTDFVIATNGAKYENVLNAWIVPEFEKQNNVKVVYTQGLSAQILARVQSQRNAPQIDLAILDELPFFQGIPLGIWEPVKAEELNPGPNIVPMAFSGNGYGLAIGLAATGLYYNTKIFKENNWAPPTSWGDLMRPELKGKVVAHAIANTHGLNLFMAATLMNGGAIPGNMEPGFEFVRKLTPNLLTWDQYGETPQLLQQGVSAIGAWSRENVVTAAKSGVPVEFVYPKEGGIGFRVMATGVKGRPAANVVLAKKLMTIFLSERAQLQFSEQMGVFPVDSKVGGFDEQVKHLVFPPPDVVAANRSAWSERWNREIAK